MNVIQLFKDKPKHFWEHMKTISGVELKVILDKHGKWLRSETDGVRANLSHANLSYANISGANLSYAGLSKANLSYADLSYANLRYADLHSADLVTFQFQMHQALFTLDGTLQIGCERMDIVSWSEYFEGIGEANGYNRQQVAAYGGFIKTCLQMFKEANP